jgi:hypothetical protein
LAQLYLGGNPNLTDLNLDQADFSSLSYLDVSGTSITRVSLRDTVLNQTALAAVAGGIGGLPGLTELDLSGVDFAQITDLSPLYVMDNLTDLWVACVQNLDAVALDTLLNNLETIEGTETEGVLHLTQADYNAFNVAGGGLLALWDAELGHRVEIFALGDANGDSFVDDADASILGSHWQVQSGATWMMGDFNLDGKVNDADAAILAAHWNPAAEGTTPSVPEPGALVTLLIGASMLLVRRGRCPQALCNLRVFRSRSC